MDTVQTDISKFQLLLLRADEFLTALLQIVSLFEKDLGLIWFTLMLLANHILWKTLQERNHPPPKGNMGSEQGVSFSVER